MISYICSFDRNLPSVLLSCVLCTVLYFYIATVQLALYLVHLTTVGNDDYLEVYTLYRPVLLLSATQIRDIIYLGRYTSSPVFVTGYLYF